MTPREHHAKHCESRGLDRMAPFERCPFLSWHVGEAKAQAIDAALSTLLGYVPPVADPLQEDELR